jgi:hypothetical protein
MVAALAGGRFCLDAVWYCGLLFTPFRFTDSVQDPD